MVGVEAGGEGIATGRHAARFADPRARARLGVLHGVHDLCAAGRARPDRRAPTRSPPGWTMPPSARSTPTCATWSAPATPAPPTRRRCRRFTLLARSEGILPALESAHAVAEAMRLAPTLTPRAGPARQPLGSRRQGPGHRHGAPWRQRPMNAPQPMLALDAIAAGFCRRPGARPRRALLTYLTLGLPHRRGQPGARALPWRAAARTSSSWACPFRTPWPTGPTIQPPPARRRCKAASRPAAA